MHWDRGKLHPHAGGSKPRNFPFGCGFVLTPAMSLPLSPPRSDQNLGQADALFGGFTLDGAVLTHRGIDRDLPVLPLRLRLGGLPIFLDAMASSCVELVGSNVHSHLGKVNVEVAEMRASATVPLAKRR